jgi:hypothetical protein
MAGRRKSVLDVREMVRRFRLGESVRRVARELRLSRRTVRKYRERALEKGLLEGEALASPSAIDEGLKQGESVEVRRPVSSVEKYRDFVVEKRKKGVELVALLRLLHERRYQGSYSSLRRFVARPPLRLIEQKLVFTSSYGAGCLFLAKGELGPLQTAPSLRDSAVSAFREVLRGRQSSLGCNSGLDCIRPPNCDVHAATIQIVQIGLQVAGMTLWKRCEW